MAPRVSVLMPCRNAADTLDGAVASLTAQTFDDFEIVAVDDGSDDRTPAMLAAWSSRDRRVRTVATPADGIVPALDTAARHARGAYLARMDADDLAAPHRLERQVAFLDEHPELAACGSQVRYFPDSIVRDGARRYETWINGVLEPDEIERDLFVECPIPHPTLVIHRSVFEDVGGYRDAGWPEDYDLILRLWDAGHRLGKVPEVLLDWREHANRLSRSDTRYDEDAFRRCKVHFLGRRIANRPVVVWGAGPTGKAFARALLDQGHDLAAFVDLDRRKIGQEIHGAPVIAPPGVVEYRHAYVLAAVGSPGGRAEVREALHTFGFTEPDDCCAVA